MYTDHGILRSCKEEWNSIIFNNMYGSRDYYSEWSKSDEDKSVILIYM